MERITQIALFATLTVSAMLLLLSGLELADLPVAEFLSVSLPAMTPSMLVVPARSETKMTTMPNGAAHQQLTKTPITSCFGNRRSHLRRCLERGRFRIGH